MMSNHPTLSLAHLQKRTDRQFRDFCSEITLTFNGSGAIYQTLKSLPLDSGLTVLAPAFHCPSVIEPIVHAGYNVQFYALNNDLTIDFIDLFKKLNSDVAAVIVVHHFGFVSDFDPLLDVKKKHGFFIIEDWAHSFLSDKAQRPKGDAAIYTFYKQTASQAGGGVKINNPQIGFPQSRIRVGIRDSVKRMKIIIDELAHNSSIRLWGRLYDALNYVRKGFKKKHISAQSQRESFWHLYQFNERVATAAMPRSSLFIIKKSNFEKIKEIRRRNYNIFGEHLQETDVLRKVFPALPEGVSPWAFPVMLEGRANFDVQLREIGVQLFTYGETLHPKLAGDDASKLDAAKWLSNNLLLFSIHQNLSNNDCLEAVEKINVFFKNQSQMKLI